MVVSPTNFSVITGGKHDNSVRIWEPTETVGSEYKEKEIMFIPKMKAFIDGTVFTVNVSDDGLLMAAGCSLKDTVSGYVVVWNMSNTEKTVLCNLRSTTLMRFGKVHSIQFMKYKNKKMEKKQNKNKRKRERGHHKKKTSSLKLMNLKDKENGFNYLLFGGDITGSILCWNLSSEFMQNPVFVISGQSDIIYDLSIVDKKWLFSVSHDQSLYYLNIEGFEHKKNDDRFVLIIN